MIIGLYRVPGAVALNARYKSFLSRYKSFAYDQGRNLIVRLSSGFID